MADLESFIPSGDEAPDSDDLFTELENVTVDEEVVVEDVVPPPFGRSWSFDFSLPGFVSFRNRGPVETRGIDTLRGWIAKCLVTSRGAHPIHPDGYGMESPFDMIGSTFTEFDTSDLEDRIREALTFHPRISGIEDFETEFAEGDEALFVAFQVLLDNEESLPIQGLRLA